MLHGQSVVDARAEQFGDEEEIVTRLSRAKEAAKAGGPQAAEVLQVGMDVQVAGANIHWMDLGLPMRPCRKCARTGSYWRDAAVSRCAHILMSSEGTPRGTGYKLNQIPYPGRRLPAERRPSILGDPDQV